MAIKRMFGTEIDAGKGVSIYHIKALNFIDEHFESVGGSIYKSDPKLLYDWYDILTAFEKYHHRVSDEKILKEEYVNGLSGFDGYEDAILRIDAMLTYSVYPFVIYDSEILSKWKHVMDYLVDYAENKYNKKIED